MNMFYIYLLKSKKDNKLYIGYTKSIIQRFKEHKAGKVFSTKYRLPVKLIYFEAYMDKEMAKEREKKLKQFGSSYSGLIKRIGIK